MRSLGLGLRLAVIPARVVRGHLLNLRFHRAALPMTLGLGCGMWRGDWVRQVQLGGLDGLDGQELVGLVLVLVGLGRGG